MVVVVLCVGRTRVQNVLRTFGRNLEDAFVWLGSTRIPRGTSLETGEVWQVAVLEMSLEEKYFRNVIRKIQPSLNILI